MPKHIHNCLHFETTLTLFIYLCLLIYFYNIIGPISHAVHFSPMTHSLCNWKYVPLNLPYLFPSFHHP